MSDVKQAHLQTAECQLTNQSLQRACFAHPERKTKNLPSLKNKTLPKRNPTDKNRMTELIYNNKGMSLDKKEGQLVTCGIFYCRDSAEIKGCGSLQT